MSCRGILSRARYILKVRRNEFAALFLCRFFVKKPKINSLKANKLFDKTDGICGGTKQLFY